MENMSITKPQSRHIIIVPTPGIGHLIPLIQFAKRLLELHEHKEFSFTFIIPTLGLPNSTMKSTLAKLPASISYSFLPPINFDDLPPASNTMASKIGLAILRSIPALRQAVDQLSKTEHVVALVVDHLGTEAFDVAFEFNIKPYIFYTSTAMCLSMRLFLLAQEEEITTASCGSIEMDTPVRIPGCVPIRYNDLPITVQDRKSEGFKRFVRHSKRCWTAEGIVVNSFSGLESGAIKALQVPEPGKPPVYAIGPITLTGRRTANEGVLEQEGSECIIIQWLDNQPPDSVLYVSFGRGGALSQNQLNELALGLEMSQHRFLWVVRSPPNNKDHQSQKPDNPFCFLPDGFLDRTKERGLVVPNWAPQVQILSHDSTRGFMSHCGWNSTLESVVHGIPIIAWPLYAEQRMNAVLLKEDVKVALRPSMRKGGLIERKEIAKVVKELMEGEEGIKMRDKMKELKNAAAAAIGEEGESTKALYEVASKWK